ncbi:CRISPR-associated protein Csx16 [Thioalkalivibrio paradoxus]|uniref:CRISPR-associated protein n=1 Tax=Thioalkalivibrio paradoxus ARh 1 TaxID=713585 RepID=W0DMD7_9GAMM|nr:CRISPR-associated protein [Thioalkalivibrio paradoxus ARh 1]
MTRRLVSFLGTGDYAPTRYAWPEFGSLETAYVAEALAVLGNVDEVSLLATDDAWRRHGRPLERSLDAHGKAVCRRALPDGRTEEDLWEQFRVLRDVCAMRAEDALLLDITHGFRTQPFFAGAVLSVLRASGQQGPDIRLLYGEYRKDEPESPVWDMTLFLELLDWSQALGLFLQTGVADPVVALSRRQEGRQRARQRAAGKRDWPRFGKLATALKAFADDLAAVRVASLITGYEQDTRRKGKARGTADQLMAAVDQMRAEVDRNLPPLSGILDQIVELARPLAAPRLASEQGQQAMTALARQYLAFGRLPEAAAVVREAAVCRYAGDPSAVEVNSPSFSQAARLELDNSWTKADPDAKSIAEVRNDIEHCGFRTQPLSAEVLKESVTRLVQQTKDAGDAPSKPGHEGRTYFVTRHPGAAEWAEQESIPVDEFVHHLDTARIQWGDTVIGTLPVQLIAQVCERGGRYRHLTLDLPAEFRGRELTADELRACRARLETFTARCVD